jgi:hypothetical protein
VCIFGLNHEGIYATGTTQTWTCDYFPNAPLNSTMVYIEDEAGRLLAQGPLTAGWVGNTSNGQNVSVAKTGLLHLAGSPANCNIPALSYYTKLTAYSWGI